MLTLSKLIPARRKTVRFDWLRRLYKHTPIGFIKATARVYKSTKCWWCGIEIKEGDELWLAALEHRGNVKLCKKCAAEMKEGNDA